MIILMTSTLSDLERCILCTYIAMSERLPYISSSGSALSLCGGNPLQITSIIVLVTGSQSVTLDYRNMNSVHTHAVVRPRQFVMFYMLKLKISQQLQNKPKHITTQNSLIESAIIHASFLVHVLFVLKTTSFF